MGTDYDVLRAEESEPPIALLPTPMATEPIGTQEEDDSIDAWGGFEAITGQDSAADERRRARILLRMLPG